MEEKMNINQAEKLTGVSKRNIRFYEKEGLFIPERDEVSGYRKYGENEIRKIKFIKMLRMLDMPLEEIRKVLEEQETLGQAVSIQQERLKKIWIRDYKKIAKQNKDREFTFMPEGFVGTPSEFSMELFAYAEKENLDIVLKKESMYPEFTLNGILYEAERTYFNVGGIPAAMIRCYRKDGEVKGEGISEKRRKMLWILQKYWPVYLLLFFAAAWILYAFYKKRSLEDLVAEIGVMGLLAAGIFRYYYLHYNEKV